ncbi:CvpA family protein [Marinobacterium mangrovicola]|uniref:Membrane protein required for colicin V production n=1 Tax=Marinobacterium mangrovicola TaxID=1476959 RepID=A0A4R1GPZ2_9GAMM|nr:CvpA family protein [Marinobacterium mangrovicola]TCK09433.1 membrane protein required for colicin V production [Marinobacterium mangrovicola]
MNWADWVILAIIAISSLMSLRRGFVREAVSLATWVVAFIVARLFATSLAVVLQDYIDTPSLRLLAAFAILFVITLIVGALVGMLIGALVSATGLSATDRVLGIGFGAVRGALVIVVIVALLGMTPAVQDSWWLESSLIPHFVLLEDWTRAVASDVGQVIWDIGR